MFEWIVFTLVLSLIPAYIAKSKGRPFATWFLLSLLFSPVIMVVVVLLVGRPKEVESS